MKFGVREICDVVFKAKSTVKIGNTTFQKGQPVLYIDTAKTSNLEAAATTVYATGGRGNSRLIAWEGEKTLTFTVEDALLSPMGFAMLSGAGLLDAKKDGKTIYVHGTTYQLADAETGEIDITEALNGDEIDTTKPIFIMTTETDGSLSIFQKEAYTYADGKFTPNATEPEEVIEPEEIAEGDEGYEEYLVAKAQYDAYVKAKEAFEAIPKNVTMFIDYYVKKTEGALQFEIDGENFAGYYYVEAATLWRRQDNGKDMPAELIFPNVKIQSNFTFAMASTGDPSTFTFTMDAMPGYTIYDSTKKVLCAIQVIADTETELAGAVDSVTGNE